MRMTIVRVTMGIASVFLIGLWPLPALLGHLVLLIWIVPRFFVDQHLTRVCRSEAHEAITTATALAIELNETQQQLASLKRQLETSRMRDPGKMDLLFRKVGLAPDCPAFAARAVRTAYRRKLHPDLQPAHRSEAEGRFKAAEVVFDEIWRRRNFPP